MDRSPSPDLIGNGSRGTLLSTELSEIDTQEVTSPDTQEVTSPVQSTYVDIFYHGESRNNLAGRRLTLMLGS